jgi:hypothetical protein
MAEKQKNETGEGAAPKQLTVDYVRSQFFRVIHADGAVVFSSSDGAIHLTVFSEPIPLPERALLEVDAEGNFEDSSLQSEGDLKICGDCASTCRVAAGSDRTSCLPKPTGISTMTASKIDQAITFKKQIGALRIYSAARRVRKVIQIQKRRRLPPEAPVEMNAYRFRQVHQNSDRSIVNASKGERFAYNPRQTVFPFRENLSIHLVNEVLSKWGQMRRLRPNWDGRGTEVPNDKALYLALKILLDMLEQSILPDRIMPSAEGGVAIVFARANYYADVECFNSGEVGAVIMDGKNEPVVWEVKPNTLRETLSKIRDHLRR